MVAVAGIDVGAVSAKAVILNGKNILGTCVLPTGHDVPAIAKEVAESALKMAGLTMEDLNFTIATGYGRQATPFADQTVTEITCHAVGANWMVPEARTIIDIGGQDSKAIRVSDTGQVIEFMMNDKCAAGTGRFLEVMAKALDLSITEFAEVSLLSSDPCQISSVCTVFAESEVISLRSMKKPREDIVAGLHKAAITRIAAMASHVGIEDAVVFTGGVAKNQAMAKALEQETGHQIIIPKEPQIIGALGAAILAQRKVQ